MLWNIVYQCTALGYLVCVACQIPYGGQGPPSTLATVTTERPPDEPLSSCRLPPKPEGSSYRIGGCQPDQIYGVCVKQPGSWVAEHTQLVYDCEEGDVHPEDMSVELTEAYCVNGTWDRPRIQCQTPTSCRLPANPEGSSYRIGGCQPNQIDGVCEKQPGSWVAEYTQLVYDCEEGYFHQEDMSVELTEAYCVNGTWDGPRIQCQSLASCSLPPKTEGSSYRIGGCQPNQKDGVCEKQPGSWVAEYTQLMYHCEEGDVHPEETYCVNGTWDRPTIQCRTPTSCRLPPKPEGSSYRIGDCQPNQVDGFCEKQPGSWVVEYTQLVYDCAEGYIHPRDKQEELNETYCENGAWYPPKIQCQKKCAPLISASLDIECKYYGKLVSCTDQLSPGTIAKPACKRHFHVPDPVQAYSENECMEDGNWEYQMFECIPDCGVSSRNDTFRIKDGDDVAPGEYPWSAGLFWKKNDTFEHFCGGSIINQNLILTAAHCIFDEETGTDLNVSDIMVAVGKFNRSWDIHDAYEDRMRVLEIKRTSSYGRRGIDKSYFDDIAVLQLTVPIKLSEFKLPVCIDWGKRGWFRNGTFGTVVGWGRDNEHEPNKLLQYADLLYLDNNTCSGMCPGYFQKDMLPDKFCVGSGEEYGPRSTLATVTTERPTDEQKCAPLISASLDIECEYYGKPVSCTDKVSPGTIARPKCKRHFHVLDPVVAYAENGCMEDGNWEYYLFECIPDCGVSNTTDGFRIASRDVTPGEYPWSAGLFMKKNDTLKHFCGGSIINSNLILTAAHCIYDEETGTDRKPSDIIVAVGKFNRSWDILDAYEDRMRVLEVNRPSSYGRGGMHENYFDDIAVLQLTVPIRLSEFRLPVCIDWRKGRSFRNGTLGMVVGWGQDEHHQPKDLLQSTILPYLDNNTCSGMCPGFFKIHMLPDKFCAGSGEEFGTAVQQGYGGGGFTFIRHKLHFLYGILSISPAYDRRFALYTNVTQKLDWLRKWARTWPSPKPT